METYTLSGRSVVSDSATPRTAARQASLSPTVSQFVQSHVYWVSDAIQPSHPLSPPFPTALYLSHLQGLTICKRDSQGEIVVWCGELKPVFCDNLEVWDGVGGGREA